MSILSAMAAEEPTSSDNAIQSEEPEETTDAQGRDKVLWNTDSSRSDREAREAFSVGGDAQQLDGLWQASWIVGDRAASEDNSYALIPVDLITVRSSDAAIRAWAHDERTNRTYYLSGRISTENVVTLIYWSQPEIDVQHKVGVVFLTLKATANEPLRLEGVWHGIKEKDGPEERGTVSWLKLSDY